MRCPKCANEETQVKDSRNLAGTRRRRRHCKKCDNKFTTTEVVGIHKAGKYPLLRPDVLKRDGGIEPYDPARFRASIDRACARRDVSTGDVDQLVGAIEDRTDMQDSFQVRAADLAEWAVSALAELDNIAAMRYAIQYLEFKKPEQFIKYSLKLAK